MVAATFGNVGSTNQGNGEMSAAVIPDVPLFSFNMGSGSGSPNTQAAGPELETKETDDCGEQGKSLTFFKTVTKIITLQQIEDR